MDIFFPWRKRVRKKPAVVITPTSDITMEEFRANAANINMAARVLNSPEVKQMLSILMHERPSRQAFPFGQPPSTLATLAAYSAGYEECLARLVSLAEPPKTAKEQPMTFEEQTHD